MSQRPPRVAFFTDSFHDVSGVARTSRNFVDYAQRSGLPFLSVRGAERNSFFNQGTVRVLELRRGRFAIPLDADLKFDLCFMRHARLAAHVVRLFGADLVHVTSPGDVGILGAWIAHRLGLPLVASWHTNIHEFAACRLDRWMAWLPRPLRSHLVCSAERFCLSAALRFYRIAKLLFAPNQELIRLIGERTGKPVYPMARGVHTDRFSPAFRSRNDDAFVLGYAGRLRPEKNVRALSGIEDALVAAGENQYRFLIIGDGSERGWLQSHLLRAEFTGFLEGEALAQAFANMDLFVFPSETDTYGNVIQEAMASGVPVLVTDKGGPKALVSSGTTGYIASDIKGFCSAIRRLMHDTSLHSQMRQAARRQACRMSWDRVFEELYTAYDRLKDRAVSNQILAGPMGGDSRSRSDALAAG